MLLKIKRKWCLSTGVHGVTSLRTVNLILYAAIPLNATIKHIYITALYQDNY
jgi:hypothetical protein